MGVNNLQGGSHCQRFKRQPSFYERIVNSLFAMGGLTTGRSPPRRLVCDRVKKETV